MVRNMKKILLITGITMGLITSAFADNASEQCNRLYVAHANQAQIQQQGNKFFLILNEMSPKMHYFCDRPVRSFGNESTQSFVDNWNLGRDSFKVDHPNAVIVADIQGQDDSNKQQYNKDVVLSSPKYDARKQQLVFEIFGLEKSEQLKTANITNPNLFIDDCELC